MDLTPETEARLAVLAALPGGRKALHQVLAEPRSFLNRARWIESIAGRSADFGGEKVPWFNYAMVRLLKERVTPAMRVFEYGSGYSTIWWERHARSVHAVEHDSRWAETLRPMLGQATRLDHRPLDYDGDYCRTIADTDGTYEVVVVDGRDRVNCLHRSIHKLSTDAVLIFDNSQRAHYREGIEAVKHAGGFRELQIAGIAPMTYIESFTSLLYRDGNCFGI